MGNQNTCNPETSQTGDKKTDAEEMEKELDEFLSYHLRFSHIMMMEPVRTTLMKTLSQPLINRATEKCQDETVRQWLRQNSESDTFIKLKDMFEFLKKHIDEEEKKNHSDSVDITFLAHGSIRGSMIPASCLLPLSTITDVLLYSPWNCTIYAGAAYGIATGLMKPQHRVFLCGKKDHCQIPNEKHCPIKLPNHWNSMRRAGDQMIPNIMISPFKPPKDSYWRSFEALTKTHGPPGRNRIIIPFIVPGETSVPFSVVTLALSLVLLSSRFKATVHLAACLSDGSVGQKFDRKYLEEQYVCTIDNTVMTASEDMFSRKFG